MERGDAPLSFATLRAWDTSTESVPACGSREPQLVAAKGMQERPRRQMWRVKWLWR